MMKTIISVAPTAYPISLTEAKLHCRLVADAAGAVAYTTEDDLLTGIIAAATGYAESVTRRALITTTFITYLDAWPADVHLPYPPLQSIVAFAYVDEDGTSTAFTDYTLDVPGNRVVIDEKPTATLRKTNPIAITYKAGYGDTGASVPGPIKQAILLLIGHYYQNREASVIGVSVDTLPQAVDALLWPYRELRW
jgi:uncharacterized phiE125 gp8 family phage protein